MIICFECKSKDETKMQESRIADHLNSRPRLQMNPRSISRIVDYTFTLLFRVYFGSLLDYYYSSLRVSRKIKFTVDDCLFSDMIDSEIDLSLTTTRIRTSDVHEANATDSSVSSVDSINRHSGLSRNLWSIFSDPSSRPHERIERDDRNGWFSHEWTVTSSVASRRARKRARGACRFACVFSHAKTSNGRGTGQGTPS